MRTIWTFVLRVLVDSEEPGALRGSVRCVSDDGEYTFSNATVLLELLHHLVTAPLALPPSETDENQAPEQRA